MRVVIANGFGLTSNVGDHALLTATVAVVRAGCPTSTIQVIPWQRPDEEMVKRFSRLVSSFSAVELIEPALPAYSRGRGFPDANVIGKLRTILWTLGVNIKAEACHRLKLVSRKSTAFASIRQCDMVVLRGCNIVQRGADLRTIMTIRRVVFPVEVARRANKRIVLLNISVGPVEHPTARWMVKRLLKSADHIASREPFTDEYLTTFGVCKSVSGADTAFAFPYECNDDVEYRPLVIGMNVLSRGEYLTAVCNSTQKYHRMIERLADEMNEVMRSKPSVRLVAIPHEMDKVSLTSDVVSLQQILERMRYPERVRILDSADTPWKVIEAYRGCSVAVGMRFHGYVLASLASTPMIGVNVSSQKVSGVAQALGLERWMVGLEREGELATMVRRALSAAAELRRLVGERSAELRQRVLRGFREYIESRSN